ncbi:MAG: type IX secretion system sortase PorU, partial [Bacteroidota bacterium]
SAGGEGWLDWFEIHYRRSLQAVNDFILFPTEDTTAVMEYGLSGFSSSDIKVFDVTDHDSVVQIINLSPDSLDPRACAFQVPLSAGAPRWLAAVGPTGFKTPVSVSQIGNSDVRGITQGAEFIIVAPREFQSDADRLRSHRQQNDSLSTIVVNIEDLTNEYAGGLTDPMAVRDFLADAIQSWAVPPQYVLLLGDGHYDYKSRKTPDRNWIPPYESLESLHQINTYASDDPMAMLFPGNTRVSLAVGRLPVNSVEEARRVIDKIIGYETTAPFGEWRNRATFVADDGLTSTRDDGSIHTFQAEAVAQTYTPAQVQKKKIYLIEYPTVNSSSGRRKPTVNTAIIDAINSGTLLLNYTGHGNPQLWAHEAVFTREGSLPQLRNDTQLFLLIAATCDYARYDDPFDISAGELLLTMENGGAIGVVTATRVVYSSDNFQFNNTFSTELFRRDSLGIPPRIGDALRRTKQIHSDLNDLKYHLLGDPTVRLNLPGYTAGVDSLNGYPLNSLTQIQALGKIDVAGEIRRQNGTRWSEFQGQALLEMYDARRTVFIPEWSFSFVVNGSLLYRGDISVNAGLYQARVPVPKDVSYDTNPARISIYAWSPSGDATGFTENVIIAGTDSSASPDTTGPGIEIFLNEDSFRSGDVVSPDPELIVRLFDENGINTSMASVGHGLEANLSTGETINLSDHYRGERDTYQSGTVRLPLRGLPEGRQTLEVRAWDTYNNSSRNEIAFDVKAISDLRLYQVYNFPNPVSRSTVFTFQRTSTEPIDVQVKLYTVAGRLVLDMSILSVIDRFVRIPWDGRDQNGDQVANGVYFYKIITRTPSGSRSEEALGKLTMLR